jgi:hypothetical protein
MHGAPPGTVPWRGCRRRRTGGAPGRAARREPRETRWLCPGDTGNERTDGARRWRGGPSSRSRCPGRGAGPTSAWPPVSRLPPSLALERCCSRWCVFGQRRRPDVLRNRDGLLVRVRPRDPLGRLRSDRRDERGLAGRRRNGVVRGAARGAERIPLGVRRSAGRGGGGAQVERDLAAPRLSPQAGRMESRSDHRTPAGGAR